MTTKTCKTCGEEKPLSAFYKHPQMADGHLNSCKACRRAYALRHQRENREAYNARHKAWRDANPDRKRYSQPAHVRAAHSLLAYALRKGEIERPDTCSECGKACTPDGHHEDYTKPLDVVWLCRTCHRKRHA